MKTKVDLQFVNDNPCPDAAFLKANVITEANVSIITTLCDTISMPVAVEYVTKTGKTGEDMLSMFTKQIESLQCCQACVENTCASELISQCNRDICNKKCEMCWEEKIVCENCHEKGQISYSPGLRACSSCLSNNIQCVHLAILALSSDCEEGNKKAMELLEQLQQDCLVDPELEFCIYIPDAVHVGKSCKCSFSNWFCLFNGSRMSLPVIHTLRDDSDPVIRSSLRRFLTKEDVQNKDRMAVEPILRLSSPDVLKVLSSLKNRVVHTLIPDKFRPTDSNKVGMYPHPISVCLGPKGKFFFLDYSPLKRETRLCLADMHNPVRVSVVKSRLQEAKSMVYLSSKGIALVVEREEKTIAVVEIEKKVALKPSTLKTKKSLQDALRSKRLSDEGTIPELRKRLQKYLTSLRNEYDMAGKSLTSINTDKNVIVDRICLASDDMVVVASNNESHLYFVGLTLDGVGVTGVVTDLSKYPANCNTVLDMYLLNGTLFISHNHGIAMIDLETRKDSVLLSNGSASCTEVQGIAPIGDQGDIAFADMGSRQVKIASTNKEILVLAGLGEEGNNDGTRASFSQPMGICVENKNNIFVTDAQVGAVKLITDAGSAVQFLENLGKLYEAFSVHPKHK